MSYPYTTGRWYGRYHDAAGSGTSVVVTNRIYFLPIRVRVDRTFDAIGLHVATAGAGGTQARLGIYNRHPTTWLPDTLLLDAGTATVASTGTHFAAINQFLGGDIMYWTAVTFSGTPTVQRPLAQHLFEPLEGGSGGSSMYSSHRQDVAFGPLPNPAVPTRVEGNADALIAGCVSLKAAPPE